MFFFLQIATKMDEFLIDTRFYILDPHVLAADLGDILAVETQIGSIFDDNITRDDDLNILTFEEVQNIINKDEMPTKVDVLAALKKSTKSILGKDITNDTKILLRDQHFFERINSVLNKLPQKVLVNYMLFREFRKLLPYTTDEMIVEEARFNARILGGGLRIQQRY